MLDETGIFDLVSTSLLFWEFLTFGILLILITYFVYPPIRDQIQKRQAEIEGAIDEAQKTREEARELLAEYRRQKLPRLLACILRLVDGALDLLLALVDLLPNRRVDVPDDQEQEEGEGEHLPEEEARLDQVEDARFVQHTFSLGLGRNDPEPDEQCESETEQRLRLDEADADEEPRP